MKLEIVNSELNNQTLLIENIRYKLNDYHPPPNSIPKSNGYCILM